MLLLWCLSMIQVISLSSWWKKFFISSVLSIILFVSVVAEFRLNFEKFSISPLQTYLLRCWFSNNPVVTFLEGCFPSSFVAEVGIFFSVILFRRSIFYSFVPEALWCCSLRPIILFCQDHVIFFLSYSFSRSVGFSFEFSHLIKFCLLPQPECCLKSFLPLVPFFH